MHSAWVAVRCEASGAKEAMPAVAVASEGIYGRNNKTDTSLESPRNSVSNSTLETTRGKGKRRQLRMLLTRMTTELELRTPQVSEAVTDQRYLEHSPSLQLSNRYVCEKHRRAGGRQRAFL